MISSPEPDTYGQYARASLLADYVELLALNDQPVRRATVADFLADNAWNLELILPIEGDPPLPEQHDGLAERLDDADEAASIVFRQLDERRHILAERYPFEIEGDRLVVHKVASGRDEYLHRVGTMKGEWLSPEDEEAWRDL